MAKYGQHHDQIKRFLKRVRLLADSDWIAVSDAAVLTSAAFGSRAYHSLERELESYKEFGIPGADKVIAQAFDDAGMDRSARRTDAREMAHARELLVDAFIGLVRCRELSVVDFTRAYLPFADKIPIVELGFDSVPNLLSAPSTVVARFATRVV
jgi:hypothetical protein